MTIKLTLVLAGVARRQGSRDGARRRRHGPALMPRLYRPAESGRCVSRRSEEAAAAEPARMPDTRELRASEAAATGPNSSGARDRVYTEMARIADRMTERFSRGEEPINLGNASLVELLAFVSAFGPIAQVDLAIDEMRRDDG